MKKITSILVTFCIVALVYSFAIAETCQSGPTGSLTDNLSDFRGSSGVTVCLNVADTEHYNAASAHINGVKIYLTSESSGIGEDNETKEPGKEKLSNSDGDVESVSGG